MGAVRESVKIKDQNLPLVFQSIDHLSKEFLLCETDPGQEPRHMGSLQRTHVFLPPRGEKIFPSEVAGQAGLSYCLSTLKAGSRFGFAHGMVADFEKKKSGG